MSASWTGMVPQPGRGGREGLGSGRRGAVVGRTLAENARREGTGRRPASTDPRIGAILRINGEDFVHLGSTPSGHHVLLPGRLFGSKVVVRGDLVVVTVEELATTTSVRHPAPPRRRVRGSGRIR